MIYFLRAGDEVKIGFSETPETAIRRLTGFQTANARQLILLGVAPGDRAEEGRLHRRLAAYRVRGEWFRAAPELLTVIGTVTDKPPSSTEEPVSMAIPTLTFTDLNPTAAPPPRLSSSFRGFDAVLGGGFVPGSTTLLSGDPGAGKSTLLLQVAAYIACRGYRAVYVTAEEAASQAQLRADRLGLALAPVQLAATGDVTAVIAALDTPNAVPALLVVDSLQRFADPALPPAARPGTPRQTHAVLAALIAYAQRREVATVIVSHVTKAGGAAGTNDLRHDVDVLLHLHALDDRRVLRAIKNRYGPTDVTASFRMTNEGVRE
jgi:DNA repair protein RadA/Sms